MDILSIIILCLVAAWFIWALIQMIRGKTCCKSGRCNGNCAACACKQCASGKKK